MTSLRTEKYSVLRSNGLDEDAAAKAASRLDAREWRLPSMKRDFRFMKWAMGFILVSQVAIFVHLLIA